MTYRLNKVSLRGIGRKKLAVLAACHERVHATTIQTGYCN
jgi:hypothetical protein